MQKENRKKLKEAMILLNDILDEETDILEDIDDDTTKKYETLEEQINGIQEAYDMLETV